MKSYLMLLVIILTFIAYVANKIFDNKQLSIYVKTMLDSFAILICLYILNNNYVIMAILFLALYIMLIVIKKNGSDKFYLLINNLCSFALIFCAVLKLLLFK